MSATSGSPSESRDFARFDDLAEEFAARFRRGERPDLQEFIARAPDLADEIRELFPALVAMERADAAQDAPDPARARRAAAPAAAPPLHELGDYRIIREVGRGGMGVVYEAEQLSLGRHVALKVLPGQIARDEKMLERFRREARAAAKLHHTNIVPVFEVGHDGAVVFYTMQFIQGQGLDRIIDELRGPAPAAAFPGRHRRRPPPPPAGPRRGDRNRGPERSRDRPDRPVAARRAVRPHGRRERRSAGHRSARPERPDGCGYRTHPGGDRSR
jgi:hypothetical protein